MIFTDKFIQALNLINSQRDLPNRKDGSPYISHPYGVALILSRVTKDESVIIAGLLHDIIEDMGSEKQITLEKIKEEFGKKVYELVDAMTEDKLIPYEIRKKVYIEKIRSMTQDMILIKSADLLHNTGTFLYQMKKDTKNAIEQFGSNYEKSMETFYSYINVMNEIWPENPLLEDLNFVTSEFKGFITS